MILTSYYKGIMSAKIFTSGKFLAVVGDDQQYWLCKCRQNVYEDKTTYFWVQWCEKEVNIYKYPIKTTYYKRNHTDSKSVKVGIK